ncbi:MAG: hypothetical protein L0027_06955 [Candidatus Rokubacteria bacterium]|nr:hypothetical protein [Candidatus Rokubacteria bacterium]
MRTLSLACRLGLAVGLVCASVVAPTLARAQERAPSPNVLQLLNESSSHPVDPSAITRDDLRHVAKPPIDRMAPQVRVIVSDNDPLCLPGPGGPAHIGPGSRLVRPSRTR